MVGLTTRERVDAFWSSTLGVSATELHAPGVHVRPSPAQRADWRGIYVLTFDAGALVSAPPDLLDQVSAAVSGLYADDVLDPPLWHELLRDAVKLAFGPVVHHYRDDPTGLDELATGRRINPRDAEQFAALRGAIAAHEWLTAGFTAQPAMLFGVFEGDRMVAAANLTAGPDAATDVGIVVHPQARGKGHALGAAATAARQALMMHGVARFRALAGNPPTLAIARRLGFAEYGRNLAVYLSG